MNKNLFVKSAKVAFLLSLFLVGVGFASGQQKSPSPPSPVPSPPPVSVWLPPTANPPSGNTPAPVNVGNSTQVKTGRLGVSTSPAFGGETFLNTFNVDFAAGSGVFTSLLGNIIEGNRIKGNFGYFGTGSIPAFTPFTPSLLVRPGLGASGNLATFERPSGEALVSIKTGDTGVGSGGASWLQFKRGNTQGFLIGQDNYNNNAFSVSSDTSPWTRQLVVHKDGNIVIPKLADNSRTTPAQICVDQYGFLVLCAAPPTGGAGQKEFYVSEPYFFAPITGTYTIEVWGAGGGGGGGGGVQSTNDGGGGGGGGAAGGYATETVKLTALSPISITVGSGGKGGDAGKGAGSCGNVTNGGNGGSGDETKVSYPGGLVSAGGGAGGTGGVKDCGGGWSSGSSGGSGPGAAGESGTTPTIACAYDILSSTQFSQMPRAIIKGGSGGLSSVHNNRAAGGINPHSCVAEVTGPTFTSLANVSRNGQNGADINLGGGGGGGAGGGGSGKDGGAGGVGGNGYVKISWTP